MTTHGVTSSHDVSSSKIGLSRTCGNWEDVHSAEVGRVVSFSVEVLGRMYAGIWYIVLPAGKDELLTF